MIITFDPIKKFRLFINYEQIQLKPPQIKVVSVASTVTDQINKISNRLKQAWKLASKRFPCYLHRSIDFFFFTVLTPDDRQQHVEVPEAYPERYR